MRLTNDPVLLLQKSTLLAVLNRHTRGEVYIVPNSHPPVFAARHQQGSQFLGNGETQLKEVLSALIAGKSKPQTIASVSVSDPGGDLQARVTLKKGTPKMLMKFLQFHLQQIENNPASRTIVKNWLSPGTPVEYKPAKGSREWGHITNINQKTADVEFITSSGKTWVRTVAFESIKPMVQEEELSDTQIAWQEFKKANPRAEQELISWLETSIKENQTPAPNEPDI